MKFYFAPGACSLAPHIALREADLAFDLEQVDLRAKQTKSGADYRAINPKGSVPALAIDDGPVLTEAAVILQWIADRKPAAKLAPAAGDDGALSPAGMAQLGRDRDAQGHLASSIPRPATSGSSCCATVSLCSSTSW